LVLFLEDGRIELDTNTVEQAIRPIALGQELSVRRLGRRSSPLGDRGELGRDRQTERREPQAWLTEVLERVVSGRTKAHELERLLPWTWQVERAAAAVEA
jgi:transposase